MAETLKEMAAAVMAEVAEEKAAKPPEKEASAEPAASAKDASEPEEAAEAGEEAKDEPTADAVSKDEPKKAKKIPDGRLSEEYAKRRKAEREAEALRKELEAVKKTTKELTPEEQIRADERARVLAEQKLVKWDEAGVEAFGENEFRAASDALTQLGFDSQLVELAQEATDNNKQAAKATFLLSQEPPEQIERFLSWPRGRQASFLYALSQRRERGEKEEAPEPKAEAKKAEKPPISISKAPKPITPITPTAAESDDLYREGQTEAEFQAALDRAAKNNPKLGRLLGVG